MRVAGGCLLSSPSIPQALAWCHCTNLQWCCMIKAAYVDRAAARARTCHADGCSLDRVRALQLPVTDEELEAINVRFGDRKGGVLYEKLWGHLGVTPPSDYVDPDAQFDRLPQPFRLVDELVRSIVDDAWEVLAARAAHPDVWQAKSQLATAPPSTFWSDLGTEAPTCVSTDAPGGRLFVGTSSGTIAVFAALRSDEPLGRISAFHTGGGGSKTDPGHEQEPSSSKEGDGEGGVDHGAVGGVTVMPAVAPAAPLPLRGANTDGVAPTNLLDPHSERGVALCVATCVPRPAPGGDVEPTDDVPAPRKCRHRCRLPLCCHCCVCVRLCVAVHVAVHVPVSTPRLLPT